MGPELGIGQTPQKATGNTAATCLRTPDPVELGWP